MPPKSPKTKPEDAKKRVKKLLTRIRNEDREQEPAIVADLTALLDADAAALAEVDRQRLLPISAEHDKVAVFELLLDRGADPTLRAQDGWGSLPCLASLMCAGREEDDARVIALAEKMVARGADPDERNEREGVLDRATGSLARVEVLLRLGVSDDSVLAALRTTVARISDNAGAGPVATRLLAHLKDVDRPGADGLSALHIVSLLGPPALLTEVLARSQNPAHALTRATHAQADHCSPPGGGLVPMLGLAAGFTARDLAAEMLALYAAATAWYGDEGFWAARRRVRLAELTANQELLAARGVPFGAPDRSGAPSFVADVDALLERLAIHVAADLGAFRRRAAAVLLAGVGPWTYASTLLERSPAILLRGAALAHVGDSWLAHIIAGDHRKFVAAREKAGQQKPDLTLYPDDAQRPLKTGVIVGGRGDELLLVWPHAEGVARLGVARPGSFTVLGDDLFGFLRNELTALGVAIDDITTGAAQGPGGGLTRILKADHDRPFAPTDINRVGGKPIGVTAETWPRRDGKPMHHVLTIDLREHPTYGPPGARALALFLFSPGLHEAYAAGNADARVLLLSDADLARGEPGWPSDLENPDELAPASLRFESAATMTQEEIYRHSFASAFPIWLQGDESDDYSGDDDYGGDDEDSEDEADARPRSRGTGPFVLQFDESLVPGVNLGDCGIMYVFAETAWFQCH